MDNKVQRTIRNGVIKYRNENGRLHRIGGPAVIYPNGDLWYYIDGYFAATPTSIRVAQKIFLD